MIKNITKLICVMFLAINKIRPETRQVFLDLFEPHYDNFYEIVYIKKGSEDIKEKYQSLLKHFKFRPFAIQMQKAFTKMATDFFAYHVIHDAESSYIDDVSKCRNKKSEIFKIVNYINSIEENIVDFQTEIQKCEEELYKYLKDYGAEELIKIDVIQPASYKYSIKTHEQDIKTYEDRVDTYKKERETYIKRLAQFCKTIEQNKSQIDKAQIDEKNDKQKGNYDQPSADNSKKQMKNTKKEDSDDESDYEETINEILEKNKKKYESKLKSWAEALNEYKNNIEKLKENIKDYLTCFKEMKEKTDIRINYLVETLKTGNIKQNSENFKSCEAYKQNMQYYIENLFINLKVIFSLFFGELKEDLSFSKPNPYYNKLQKNGIIEDIYKEMSEAIHFKNLLERIQEDQQIIKKMLDIKESDELQLIDIEMNNGDYHTQGGGVSILTFKKNDGQAKLIYKTGSIRIDLLIIGDIGFYNENRSFSQKLPDFKIEKSYFEILNISNNNSNTSVSPIKPYKIIPIETYLKDDRVDFTKSYGYIEFIEGKLYKDILNLPDEFSKNDKVTNHPYYHLGFLIEAIKLIRNVDMHKENVIVNIYEEDDEKKINITPIDFEVSFPPNIYDEERNSELLTYGFKKLSEIATYKTQYEEGVKKFYELFETNHKFINAWFESTAVKTMLIRFVPIGTRYLDEMLWCYPKLKAPHRPSAYYVMNNNFMEKLSRWEIPAFYMYANKKELYNAEGEMIIFNKEENLAVLDNIDDETSRKKAKLEYMDKYEDKDPICRNTPYQDTYNHFKEFLNDKENKLII